MTVPTVPAVRRLTRARRRMRNWLLVIGAVLAVAVIVTALLGGFADRPIEKLASADRDRPVDTGEVTVTVKDAVVETSGPAIEYPSDDRRYLVVDAVLENHTDEPFDSANVSLRIQGATIDFDTPPSDAVRLSDLGQIGLLQPSLPTRIAWMWRIEPGVRLSDVTVDAVVVARPRRQADPIFDDRAFGPIEGIVRIPLPVRVVS